MKSEQAEVMKLYRRMTYRNGQQTTASKEILRRKTGLGGVDIVMHTHRSQVTEDMSN